MQRSPRDPRVCFFFFNDTATTEIYTLSLHDALPIYLGSGAGTDSLVAAQMVGEDGHVTGLDMTPEMLTKARAAAAEMGAANVEFVESEAEQLPFPDASFEEIGRASCRERV